MGYSFPLTKLVSRYKLATYCIQISAIFVLLWHNVILLRKLRAYNQYMDNESSQRAVQMQSNPKDVNPQYDQQSASAEVAKLLGVTVEPNLFDSISSLEWPPMDLVDAIIANSNSSHAISSGKFHPITPRLIVTTATAEDFAFADNFANSLLSKGVKNFVLVPLDEEAFQRLQEVHPKHTLPLFPKLDQHNIIVSRQPILMSTFLQKGFAVFYNDADVVWQHNAWNEIDQQYESHEDVLSAPEIIFWNDEPFQICDCMIYALPTINSLHIMDQWDADIRRKHEVYDETALTQLVSWLQQPRFLEQMISMKVWSNDLKFPSGKSYSWDVSIPENEQAVIIHNNWIVGGVMEQRQRFEKVGLWNPSK